MKKKQMKTDKELTVGIVQSLWAMLMGTGRYEDVSITHEPESGRIDIEAKRKKK